MTHVMGQMTCCLCHWPESNKKCIIFNSKKTSMETPFSEMYDQISTDSTLRSVGSITFVVAESSITEGEENGRKCDVMTNAVIVFSQETCQYLL